jgi:UDP-N-acetylmuramoyl-tripeptide--D-alanyl-D-alanine ligase
MAVFRWTDEAVRKALGLEGSTTTSSGVTYDRVSTDSRSVGEGDLFVALQGPRFDGNTFVDSALKQGARGAVTTRDVASGGPIYAVEDTLEALGRLAAHRRTVLAPRVVAVTGSSGKTGTKEFLRAALAGSLATHVTDANLNNRIGLPLTILSAPDDTDVLVLEMGTSEPGEIAKLTGVAQPDIAIITTVSETHLEGLGSLGGVLEEKLAIFQGLPSDGIAFVGESPTALIQGARKRVPDVKVAGFSSLASEDLRPQQAIPRADGCWSFEWRGAPVMLRIAGRHAVTNALLALAAAEALGVDPAQAAAGVSTVEPQALRGERRTVGSLTLLLDCYNANPQSTRAALEVLRSVGGQHRPTVAFLGSMLELGDRAAELHQSVLEDAVSGAVDTVVATGRFAAAAEGVQPAEGVKVIIEEDPEEAYASLAPSLGAHEVVLLKGSRGVALERLVPLFEHDFGHISGDDSGYLPGTDSPDGPAAWQGEEE